MKTNYKTICVTAVGVVGLVPAMSYIHPAPDQSDLPNHAMIREFSPGISDGVHKAVMLPVLLDATGTMTSGSMILSYSS